MLCLTRISNSQNYPYSNDQKAIKKALRQTRLKSWYTYIALAAGAIFICLLLLKTLYMIGTWAYEKYAYRENKPLFTETDCEIMYYDINQLLEDYPNLNLPEYIPESYSFYSAYVVTAPEFYIAGVNYLDNEENMITFSYQKFAPDQDSGFSTIEADKGSSKAFEKDGILYEQVTNCGSYSIVWEKSFNEYCKLFGVDTEENAHKIAFSIK